MRSAAPLSVRVLLTVAALLSAWPAAARERAPHADEAVREGTVRAVIDGDTLTLQSGIEVRLVGIQAPKLPLGRRGFRPWPLAEEAKSALAELTLGRRLLLSYGGRRTDRHGRLLAHLHDEAGGWIQGIMLSRGLARVYTFADNRDRAGEMLAAETAARKARRGLWAHPFYRVREVTETPEFIDTFQLVEGQVRQVAVVRGRAYLNFGADWRTDFTVSVAPAALRRFEGGRAALDVLEGRRIRVRGWLKRWNGPMIEATHPEQIERLQ